MTTGGTIFTRRALTPEDHEQIRRWLALIPVFVWLLYGWRDLLRHLPLGLPGENVQFSRDFIQFYVQGAIANRGNPVTLYDIEAWPALVRQLVPGSPELRFPPIYAPQMSVLFSPLARLPYETAMIVWVVLSLAAYMACGYVLWKACPKLRDHIWMATLLLLADPGLHFTITFGQISPFALLAVTGGFFALRANRPFLAGLSIGSLFYKPQLGVAAAFIFLFAREWRLVAGAVLAAVLQLAAGCAFWGVSILPAYVTSFIQLLPQMPTQFEPFRFHMHGWRGFFDVLGLPTSMAIAAYLVASLLTLVVALRCWRSAAPLAIRYSVFLIATVLVDPHVYVYDLILLTPALLFLLDWTLQPSEKKVGDVFPAMPGAWLRERRFTTAFQGLLYVAYLSPLAAIVALTLHFQPSPLALAAIGLTLAKCAIPAAQPAVQEAVCES